MGWNFRKKRHGNFIIHACIIACIIGIWVTAPFAASTPTGHITYTLSTENGSTTEGQQAYARIKIAMDSAMYYYNTYTHITKAVRAAYVPSVQTADGNSNGSIRFGSNKAYQVTCTAMHEIAHTIGVGTASQWSGLIRNNVYTGKNGGAKLKEIDGPEAVLKGDNQHFWPYGLNYASEVKSNQDLINHCLMVDAIYKDLYPTGAVACNTPPQQPSISIVIRPDISFIALAASPCRMEAALFTLAGRRVAEYSQKFDLPGDYTIPLDRSSLPAGRYVYRITAGAVRTGGTLTIVR